MDEIIINQLFKVKFEGIGGISERFVSAPSMDLILKFYSKSLNCGGKKLIQITLVQDLLTIDSKGEAFREK